MKIVIFSLFICLSLFQIVSSSHVLKESNVNKLRSKNKLFCFYPSCFNGNNWVSNGVNGGYNGCSAGIFKGTNFGWTSCCNQHDLCWNDCQKTQAYCDNQFKSCMDSVCNSKYSKWYQAVTKLACKATASVWKLAVEANRCGYIETQKRLCKCT